MSKASIFEGDLNRLPKWARSRIEVAERNVEYWKGIANIVTEDQSDTFYMVAGSFNDKKNLPPGTGVLFQLGPDYTDIIEAQIIEKYLSKKKRLEIFGHGLEFRIIARASNLIYLELAERDI